MQRHKPDPEPHTIVTFYNKDGKQVSQYDTRLVNFGGLVALHRLDEEKHGKLTYKTEKIE